MVGDQAGVSRARAHTTRMLASDRESGQWKQTALVICRVFSVKRKKPILFKNVLDGAVKIINLIKY